jgi:predicted SAM-dependent methyltransferase
MKKLLRPLYRWLKHEVNFLTFKMGIKKNKHNLKVVVGSAGFYEKGWIPTELEFLNLLDESQWDLYFKRNSISNVLAEHVWEHLTPEQGMVAANTCFRFLKPQGKLRIAVPDGFHQDQSYIDFVKPGGLGAGADDHKILYNYQSLSAMLEHVGFKVELVEYFNEARAFVQQEWSVNDGHIHRSFKHDKRNRDGYPHYTSLIVDAIKP